MIGFEYFPSVIYRDERPDLASSILSVCLNSLSEQNNLNSPLCQSQDLRFHSSLIDISEYVLGGSVEILNLQGYLTDNYDFYISGLWAQQLNSFGSTNIHVHRNSQMCGWIFLQVPSDGAYPIYYDSRKNKEIIELDSIQSEDVLVSTNSIHFKNVVPGTVFFSNSWVNHQLVCRGSTQQTVVLHFIVSHRDKTI